MLTVYEPILSFPANCDRCGRYWYTRYLVSMAPGFCSYPQWSMKLFIALQTLDAATTIIGLQAGASEAAPVARALIALGPVAGVITLKLITIAAGFALLRQRPLSVRWINAAFVLIVLWNCGQLAILAGVPRNN